VEEMKPSLSECVEENRLREIEYVNENRFHFELFREGSTNGIAADP
jgi:hypothetical protein